MIIKETRGRKRLPLMLPKKTHDCKTYPENESVRMRNYISRMKKIEPEKKYRSWIDKGLLHIYRIK